MKYTVIDYKATGDDPVEILSFMGYNSPTDIPVQENDVARVIIEGLADVASLGEPILTAVAYYKGVVSDAEAVWEAINPSPKRPITATTDVSAPPKPKKISRSRPKKTTDTSLQSATDTSTSASVVGDTADEGNKEIDMTDKEKAKATKDKEKAKALAAKDKEKAAKLKAKEKDAAAKAKAKDKADKLKAKEAAAKAKAKEKADKAKANGGAKRGRPPGTSTGPRGEKTLKIKAMLERKSGCTRKQVLEATGWPSVSMQAIAKNLKVKLKSHKEKGKPIVYSA